MLFGKFIEMGSTLKDFQDEAVVGFNSKISMCFCVCVFFSSLHTLIWYKKRKWGDYTIFL